MKDAQRAQDDPQQAFQTSPTHPTRYCVPHRVLPGMCFLCHGTSLQGTALSALPPSWLRDPQKSLLRLCVCVCVCVCVRVCVHVCVHVCVCVH